VCAKPLFLPLNADESCNILDQPLRLTLIILQERQIGFVNHQKTPPSGTQSSTAWHCSFRLLLQLQQQHAVHAALPFIEYIAKLFFS